MLPSAEYNYYNTGLIASRFYSVLGERDLDRFKQAVWNSVLIVVSTCIVSLKLFDFFPFSVLAYSPWFPRNTCSLNLPSSWLADSFFFCSARVQWC